MDQISFKRFIPGIIAAVLFICTAIWFINSFDSSEASVLMDTGLSTIRSFCHSLILALSNILALMLTLLSLSANTSTTLKWDYFQHVKQIAMVVTTILLATIFLYLFLNIPFEEYEIFSGISLYYYYGLIVFVSLLGGGIISIIILLYNIIKSIINIIGAADPDKNIDSEIVKNND